MKNSRKKYFDALKGMRKFLKNEQSKGNGNFYDLDVRICMIEQKLTGIAGF